MKKSFSSLLKALKEGHLPSPEEAFLLAELGDTAALAKAAVHRRDAAFGNVVTYSRKLFLPLTRLCRDVCHYCTFATTPKKVGRAYMSLEEVLEEAHRGTAAGCREALFTLGEKPELRYRAARDALAEMGAESTIAYTVEAAERVFSETGLLPHINAGNLSAEEFDLLRPVSASMGLMLESAAPRLCEKGMPHYGSPDKHPELRLATIELAGEKRVPFTSGILIGIGETRRERVEALLALRASHLRHGHIQEIIVQNFRAKPGTRMAAAPEPDLEELLWSIAMARLLFGPETAVQAPPNLSPGVLPRLVEAGINDWGGVSPVTPDYVNPEAPWPHVEQLSRETARAGKLLCERLTVYPRFLHLGETWLDPAVQKKALRVADAEGLVRNESWSAGGTEEPPAETLGMMGTLPWPTRISQEVRAATAAAEAGRELPKAAIARLFQAREADFAYLCRAADTLRREVAGDEVSYVVNRNINYTNICYFGCRFCAFSRGRTGERGRDRPYNLSQEEIAMRVREAWQRGATEVCLQGGIHPDYTGETYLAICRTIKRAAPDIHIHAFSPLEVWQGAATLGISLEEFLQELRQEGLSSLPGTAAEILDDEMRAILCPDKINTAQWLSVMAAAHRTGLRSTATVMFGHADQPRHWAEHLLRLRRQQTESGGFTEFVPLPFVAMEAPLYRRGKARPGPTFREAVLMHAVARLVLYPHFSHIQTSWVKLGESGTAACLKAGADDLGGTLMNESITRSAGAAHGQEVLPLEMECRIRALGRRPRQRTTLYGEAPAERVAAARAALPLAEKIPISARSVG